MYNAEPDVFFHLTIGSWIRSHSAVPTTDLWSNALAGKPWIDQNWLFQLALSSIESSFGWQGLIVFKLAVCVLTVIAMFYLFAAVAKEKLFAGLVVTMCACGVLEQSPLSPELLVWCLLPCCISLVLKEASTKVLCAALVVGVLLGNVQPAWLLFVILLSLALRMRWQTALAYCAGGLCSPYFGKQFFAAFDEVGAFARYGLQTHATFSSIFDFRAAFLVLLWVLLIFLSVIGRTAAIDKRGTAAAATCSLIAILFSAVLPAALIVTGWALCSLWPQFETSASPLVISIRGLERLFMKLPAPGTLWLLFCVVLVNSINAYRIPLIEVFLPVKELDYVIENNLPDPIWHEPAVGPYVVYRFSNAMGEPQRKSRIDIRALPSNLETFVEENQNRWTIAFEREQPRTVLVRSNAPEYEALSRDERFKKIELVEPGSDDPEAPRPKRKMALSWVLFTRTIE